MRDIALLKEALPYFRRHRGRTMVVKLGGEIADDDRALRSLAQDLSLLSHVNIPVVVVHGGGPQATELSKKLGLTPRLVDGRRVTDEATLEVTKMVFAGQINMEILSVLRAQGLRGVGLSGVDGNLLRAVRRPPTMMTDRATGESTLVDFGHVGDVQSADPHLLTLLVQSGYVPVISSLGSDDEGHILNINADTVAAVIARAMSAAKLITLTNVPGLLRDPKDPSSLISRLSLSEARVALRSGSISGGMAPKVESLIDAVEGGVEAGHILSGLDESALLLELFTDRGAGTLIEADAAPGSPASPPPTPPSVARPDAARRT